MKKNKIMRIASVLMVLTILSTCAISGTFAKYTTSGTSVDDARVAKWGITITATEADALFANTYDATVSSNVDVVAPGTNGTFGGFTVTGTPEVSTAVSYQATINLTGNWEDQDGNFYFPLTIAVAGTNVDWSTAVGNAATYAEKIAAVEAAVKTAIEAKSASYNPGDSVAAGLTFTWNWAIGEASEADTQLGNIATGIVSGKTAPNISISVTATITQVD